MRKIKITCVVLLEVAHEADDPDPDEHGAQAQEDTAHVVAGEDLGGGDYYGHGSSQHHV